MSRNHIKGGFRGGGAQGGPAAPFVRDFFFVSKRVSDGISNWLLKYIFALINIVNN